MRQAIEEGFILDVLQNYTPYSLAFKLANDGKEMDDKEVERSEAMKALMRWVRLHPYNISQKVQIVVEHYRAMVQPLLDGKAKAMVVVGSRIEAVRWQLAIEKYIKSKGYKLGTLVAFSGEVNDQESGPDPFTRDQQGAEPGPQGARHPRGLQAARVSTSCWSPTNSRPGSTSRCSAACMSTGGWRASRPCRRCPGSTGPIPGKDTTYVLDFVNSSDDILKAFQTYYETADAGET